MPPTPAEYVQLVPCIVGSVIEHMQGHSTPPHPEDVSKAMCAATVSCIACLDDEETKVRVRAKLQEMLAAQDLREWMSQQIANDDEVTLAE